MKEPVVRKVLRARGFPAVATVLKKQQSPRSARIGYADMKLHLVYITCVQLEGSLELIAARCGRSRCQLRRLVSTQRLAVTDYA